jgi:hypothetical protein
MPHEPWLPLSGQKECRPVSTPTFHFYSYQYYNELSMTVDIKTEIDTDDNAFKLTLKPKLNGHWSDKIQVRATIKLGTRTSIIDADKLGNGNFGMTIRNYLGPGTYGVSINVKGTNVPWYPDEADRHCESNYKGPSFVHVGPFNWEYQSKEEYTFTPENQPVLRTLRPVNVERTTPNLLYEESSDDLSDEEPSDLSGKLPTDDLSGKLPTDDLSGKLPNEDISGKLPSEVLPGSGNQHNLQTQRPVPLEPTTPKLTDQEAPNDLLVLYIVVPIVVLAVVFILFFIFYFGKNNLKSKKGYDEDSEEGAGAENEDENDE